MLIKNVVAPWIVGFSLTAFVLPDKYFTRWAY